MEDVFIKGRNHWIAVLGGALNYTREQLDAAYKIGTLVAREKVWGLRHRLILCFIILFLF